MAKAFGAEVTVFSTSPAKKEEAIEGLKEDHFINSKNVQEMQDVFKSCAEQWGLETLIKELDCVRKIFRESGDFKGQKLHLKADLISMLENKVMSPSDVCSTILQFFNSTDQMTEFPISNVIPSSKPHPHQTSSYNNTGSSSGRGGDNRPKGLPHMNANKMIIEDEWSVKSSKKKKNAYEYAYDSVEEWSVTCD